MHNKRGAFAVFVLAACVLSCSACAGRDAPTKETHIPYQTVAETDDAAGGAASIYPADTEPRFDDGEAVYLDPTWRFAEFSELSDGNAVFYAAKGDRLGITVAVNAGHGSRDGHGVYTYCHPDKTPKVTGGTTAEGSLKAVGVSAGMTFNDGATESEVNLKVARSLRDELLERGYDVLMLRDGDDVRLDNVARTVIASNCADCHISIHWDGDGLDHDKGAFYISVPDGIKYLDNVAATWEASERLGECLISGLAAIDVPIRGNGYSDIDLTQTSYTEIPSVDIELGNQCSEHSEGRLALMASALADGIDRFYGGK